MGDRVWDAVNPCHGWSVNTILRVVLYHGQIPVSHKLGNVPGGYVVYTDMCEQNIFGNAQCFGKAIQ